MKNLKLILIATIVAVLAVATIGVAFADNYRDSSYYGMMGYDTDYEAEDWWNEMRERMEDHWDEVQDEDWFEDMRAYMDDHLDDIENQNWFDEMYDYGYHGCH